MKEFDPIVHECEATINGKNQKIQIRQSQMDALNNLLNNIIAKEEASHIVGTLSNKEK